MIRQTLLAASFALAFGAAHAAEPLNLKVYNADGNSFHANAVVVSGKSEAVVIDTGFTRADAYRIAANVLDSGKTLKTILISNVDPDYYFGAEVLKQIFPQAEVVTTAAVREKISAKLAGKVAFWGPKMGANAPVKPVLPTALAADKLTVDGEEIAIPGHMLPGTALDTSTIDYTRQYLLRFDSEAAKAKTGAELIDAMKRAYPEAGLGIALDIGAKVNKGEMKW
jgi:glyoxylase-like metal-dependent hydrolase (beta-lactamase superfamily II)